MHHRSALDGIEAYRIASNQAFPRHAHDQFGIGIIDSGAQRSWSGIGPVESEAGDLITVNPGEIHDGIPIEGRIRKWRMLYVDPVLLDRLFALDAPANTAWTRPTLRDPLLARRFVRLFAHITAPRPDIFAAEEETLRTIAHLCMQYASRPIPARSSPPGVAKALERLHDAPAHPVSLAELAALSNISRFQLLRGFVRATGITPHAYLLQQRVRLARRLLVAGHRPAQAAAEAGFADQSHLTRAFRRQLGTTPARYRASLG